MLRRYSLGWIPADRDVLRAAITTALAAGLVFGPAGSAMAADSAGTAASGKGAGLEEIVVTAQRREQSLQDVPVSINAFTAKDIANRAATNLGEIVQTAPNVGFSSSVVGQSIRIRGVGTGDNTLIFDPGVGVYIDGLYMPRMDGLDFDLLGIERVEVLRGPQGTLFGRNTIGGAVNITTSKPSKESSAEVEAITGSFNRFDALMNLQGPLIKDVLAGQISLASRTRDGYGARRDFVTGTKIDTTDNVNRYSVRGGLDWTPSENLDVVLHADKFSASEKGQMLHIQKTFQTPYVQVSNSLTGPVYGMTYNDQFVTKDVYTSYATGPNGSKLDNWDASLTVDWRISPKTKFRSITAYFNQSGVQEADLDGSPLNLFEQPKSGRTQATCRRNSS